jgi:hypothetical protein
MALHLAVFVVLRVLLLCLVLSPLRAEAEAEATRLGKRLVLTVAQVVALGLTLLEELVFQVKVLQEATPHCKVLVVVERAVLEQVFLLGTMVGMVEVELHLP